MVSHCEDETLELLGDISMSVPDEEMVRSCFAKVLSCGRVRGCYLWEGCGDPAVHLRISISDSGGLHPSRREGEVGEFQVFGPDKGGCLQGLADAREEIGGHP